VSSETLPTEACSHTSWHCGVLVMPYVVPFSPFKPLAQAALPDSQNTANVTVKKKSCEKKKLRGFYKIIHRTLAV
jgi:hypothetical protein